MITRAKISAVRANCFVVVKQFIVFFLVIRNSSHRRCGAYSRAALINFFVPDAALNRVNTVIRRKKVCLEAYVRNPTNPPEKRPEKKKKDPKSFLTESDGHSDPQQRHP